MVMTPTDTARQHTGIMLNSAMGLQGSSTDLRMRNMQLLQAKRQRLFQTLDQMRRQREAREAAKQGGGKGGAIGGGAGLVIGGIATALTGGAAAPLIPILAGAGAGVGQAIDGNDQAAVQSFIGAGQGAAGMIEPNPAAGSSVGTYNPYTDLSSGTRAAYGG